MKDWIIIGALIWAFGAPAALWMLYDHEHKARVQAIAELSAAKQENEALKKASKAETTIQTVTRTVYVKAQKEIDNVQRIDAKCENGDDLVYGFRAGIERMRDIKSASHSSAAVSTGKVSGAGARQSEDGQ